MVLCTYVVVCVDMNASPQGNREQLFPESYIFFITVDEVVVRRLVLLWYYSLERCLCSAAPSYWQLDHNISNQKEDRRDGDLDI